MNHHVTFYNKEVQARRRVGFIVGARDFKTLKAKQFMQDGMYAYQREDDGETLAPAMTEGDLVARRLLTKTTISWEL